MKTWAVCIPVLFGLVGCTYSVHQASLGGFDLIPEGARVHRVHADTEQGVVLYITDNTDYADHAYRALLAQCPAGELRDIETRSSTSHGFLSFTNHLDATALCVE